MKQRILNTKIIYYLKNDNQTKPLWGFFYIKQFGVYVEKVTIAICINQEREREREL